jgi:hypothetical protein
VFTIIHNFAIPFCKLPGFACRIEMSEIWRCLTLTFSDASVLPLDALPQLMPSVEVASGIFNGKSDLIKDLLDVVIFTKQIRTVKHILHCSSVTHVSCELCLSLNYFICN